MPATQTRRRGTAASRKAATNGADPIPSGDPLARYPFRFDVIATSDMFVDKAYQRPLTSFAKRIEERFNPALILTLALSERSNGKFAVIDGQTRMVAAEKLGFTELPACVFTDLTKEQEAEIFELLGTERRAVTSFDRFRASLASKNAESIAINNLVQSLGMEIGKNFPAQITAIGALRQCYRRDPIQLERTLVDLRETWPDMAPPGDLIKGMHLFFTPRDRKLRTARQAVDDTKLVQKLQVAGLDGLRRRVNAAREAAGKTTQAARYTARAIAVINGERDPKD